MFKAAEALGGAILFFDELDALGGNRESGDIHEVSRRMLSVMLRYVWRCGWEHIFFTQGTENEMAWDIHCRTMLLAGKWMALMHGNRW